MNENLPKSYTADFYTTFSSFSIFEFSIKKKIRQNDKVWQFGVFRQQNEGCDTSVTFYSK